MMKKTILKLSIAIAIGAISAAAPMYAVGADCEVKMGYMGPLSGAAASWGIAGEEGVKFVYKKLNDKGGIKIGDRTCEIKVYSYDSKYTADAAAAGANFLNSRGVKVISGPTGSPEVTGVKPVAARNGQITVGASYALNAIQPQFPLAFQQSSTPTVWAGPIIDEALKHFKINKVFVVAPNDQGGTDIAKADTKAYKDRGIDTIEEYYQRGTANFSPIVERILKADVDVVDVASSPPGDGATIAKQLYDAGFKGVLGRLGGPGATEILAAVGGPDKLPGFYWFESVSFDSEGVKRLVADFKEVMGRDAPRNTIFPLQVAMAENLIRAIQKAGTWTDAKKVAEALLSVPPRSDYLGEGYWSGKKIFGINQMAIFPVGFGLVKNGKVFPVQELNIK